MQHKSCLISHILVSLMFKIGEKRSSKIFIRTYEWKNHEDLVGYEVAMFAIFSNILFVGYFSTGADKRINFSGLGQRYDTKYKWLAKSMCCAYIYMCMSGGLRNKTWLKYVISAIMQGEIYILDGGDTGQKKWSDFWNRFQNGVHLIFGTLSIFKIGVQFMVQLCSKSLNLNPLYEYIRIQISNS